MTGNVSNPQTIPISSSIPTNSKRIRILICFLRTTLLSNISADIVDLHASSLELGEVSVFSFIIVAMVMDATLLATAAA